MVRAGIYGRDFRGYLPMCQWVMSTNKPLCLDVETTIFEKGNPFARRNKLCYVGVYRQGGSIFVGSDALLPFVQREIVSSPLLVGFNLKFDLHWLQRYGITPGPNQRVWDCQLAHFLLTSQRVPYPSLDGVAEHYGIPGKLGYINDNYWKRGIDTPEIPQQEMLDYLQQDLVVTMQVYERQVEEFKQKQQLYKLFQIQCQDLLVLQEMEWNGLMIDTAKAEWETKRINDAILEIERTLRAVYPSVPINFDSGDHLSCFLYGGTIRVDRREVAGLYKSGVKAGKERFRIIEDVYELPRIYEPIKGSELKKEGYWSTDESLLRQLKGTKWIITALLGRSSLCKLLDYYVGLPTLIAKKDWPNRELHGQLNQCVAVTGRLSASQPNQQNIEEHVKEIFVSRFS